MTRKQWGAVGVGGLLAVVVARLLAVVPDAEMAPSLLAGDLVLLLPIEPHPGDVVAIVDPLDPARWTLRRVVSGAGNVRYEHGSFIVDDAPLRLLEMGRDEQVVTLREGDALLQQLARPVAWEQDVVTVADGQLWLGADNRDLALDSRWWGPVPEAYVQGVVVARLGPPGHRWRGWFSGRA